MIRALVAAACVSGVLQAPLPSTPEAVVNELLAADRAFGSSSTDTTAVDALAAAFADDVAMMVGAPSPGFAKGKERAITALRSAPDNGQGHLTWAPVRGGISADGRHGFTFGYMRGQRPNDDAPTAYKYVAYWTRTADGWRIVVYKRVRANQPPETPAMMAPVLPDRFVAPLADPAIIERHRASLEAAERAFSDEAQRIGLAAAFATHGHHDAVNVGPPNVPTFVVGAAAIGQSVGGGTPTDSSPLAWAPDEGILVASSGDLGVTFGTIRRNGPTPAGQPAKIPFITVWHRATESMPWRYIAE